MKQIRIRKLVFLVHIFTVKQALLGKDELFHFVCPAFVGKIFGEINLSAPIALVKFTEINGVNYALCFSDISFRQNTLLQGKP